MVTVIRQSSQRETTLRYKSRYGAALILDGQQSKFCQNVVLVRCRIYWVEGALLPIDKPYLPPSLEHQHRRAIREIQAPAIGLHRQT
jgi:hypothetical protein